MRLHSCHEQNKEWQEIVGLPHYLPMLVLALFGVDYSKKWCLLVLIFLFHVRRTIAVLLIPRSCWPCSSPYCFLSAINYTHSTKIQPGTKIKITLYNEKLSLLFLFCPYLLLYNIDIVQSAVRIVISDVLSCPNGMVNT